MRANRHHEKHLRATGLGIAAVTVLLCTACFTGDTTGESGEETAAPGQQTPSSTYTAEHSVGNNPQAPETDVPTNPTWLPGDEAAAKEVATKALADFARPQVEETQWANDFARWLTPEATTAYSAVDPANVPVTKVTGQATLELDEANGFGVVAIVPTDIGNYRMQLLRRSQAEPWKVNRLYPPEGIK